MSLGRASRGAPARTVSPRPVTSDEAREATGALVDSLAPLAWALVEAVHARDSVRVHRLLTSSERLDVIALILASQLPHAPRTTRGGRTVECGTNEGFGEHLRRGEPTCAACRAAHAVKCPSYAQRAAGDTAVATRRSALDALYPRPRLRRVA